MHVQLRVWNGDSRLYKRHVRTLFLIIPWKESPMVSHGLYIFRPVFCPTVRENDYKLPCGVVYASEDSGHVGNLDYRFHTHIYPIPSESSERVRQPPHLDLHMKTN